MTLTNDGPFRFPGGGVQLSSGSEAFLPKGFSRIENTAESRPSGTQRLTVLSLLKELLSPVSYYFLSHVLSICLETA